MRNLVTTLLLVLGCLLNQVAYESVRLEQHGDAVQLSLAAPATSCVFLRTCDSGAFPTIAEALLSTYVVPGALPTSLRSAAAADQPLRGEFRPTLQSLDIRLQV